MPAPIAIFSSLLSETTTALLLRIFLIFKKRQLLVKALTSILHFKTKWVYPLKNKAIQNGRKQVN
jgi:hypothetical protein